MSILIPVMMAATAGANDLLVPVQGVVVKETVLHQATHEFEVELNAQTVLCSHADYSADFLKILIPQLSGVTLLNHRNAGAGAPCVAAGECKKPWNPDGKLPSDIIDAAKPTEKIRVSVEVLRVTYKDAAQCAVEVQERIKTNIRGVDFFHLRGLDAGQRLVVDCD